MADRWSSGHRPYLRKGNHSNQKLQRAWDKYGESSFVFSVIEHVDDDSLLVGREQYYMNLYQAVDTGYNILRIAERVTGYRHTDETKRKLSILGKSPENVKRVKLMGLKRAAGMVGKPGLFTGHKHSDEAKAKLSISSKSVANMENLARMSAAHIGKPSGNAGKKHSKETLARMSAAQIGRVHSEESKAKMSSAKKGCVITPEHRAKLSAARKGVPWSEAARKAHEFADSKKRLHKLETRG